MTKIFTITLILLSSITIAEAAPMTLEQLRQQRQRMAQRQRRIIFNNDGDETYFEGVDTLKEFLDRRTTALLGSQVDTITYYSTWGMKLHHSDGPFGRLYGLPDVGNSPANYRKILAETGKDNVEIMIETCHANNMEFFYSNRMNDWHDSFTTAFLYNIRTKHPQWSLGTESQGRKYTYPDVRSCWSAWDFEVPEIRQLTLDALREVCRNYDVDGIELDFLRGTIYFKPTMELRAVEQKHLDIMNDLMRQIRKMTEEEGQRRGRPILIMARITNDVPLSKSIGLDVQTWLTEGLIDLLHIGTWIDFDAPMKPVIDLAHRHDVPVYPMVHAKQHADGFKDKAVWRGEALWRLWEGADGVYTFNVFDPHLWLWWELGDRAAMAGKDRTYVWDYLPSQRRESDVLPVMRLTRFRRPVQITSAGGEAMPLFIGEDPASPAPEGKRRVIELRVAVQGMTKNQKLLLTVNGHLLKSAAVSEPLGDQPKDVTFSYHPDPSALKPGENRIEAKLEGEGTVTIDDMRLEVRFQPSE